VKVLFYRRGGLGDTLLTFPALEILSRRGYEITAVGNTDYFRIAQAAGWVNRVLPEMPGGFYDLRILISAEGNIPPFPRKRRWIVEHYLRSLALWGERFSCRLPLAPLSSSPLEGKVVLHPSSGSPRKNPELSLFLKVERFIRDRGFETVFLAGEADLWLRGRVENLVVSTDPLWIARALKGALLFIGLDSGISHLASYVGTPSVVIYGPTDPLVWRPLGFRVFQILPYLLCAPCFPQTCAERPCLDEGTILKNLLPLLNKLLIKIHKHNLL